MNLFWLSQNHTENAQFHVDRHVVKMPIEACQILSNAHPVEIAPYKRSHINHPAAKWIRESVHNYRWAAQYAKSLCVEYTFRYGRRHKTEDIADWLIANEPRDLPVTDGITEAPRCFGEFKERIQVTRNVVDDYRMYMLLAKKHLFVWKFRDIPEWAKIVEIST